MINAAFDKRKQVIKAIIYKKMSKMCLSFTRTSMQYHDVLTKSHTLDTVEPRYKEVGYNKTLL